MQCVFFPIIYSVLAGTEIMLRSSYLRATVTFMAGASDAEIPRSLS